MPPKRIMIIDDNREFLREFAETLALSGYEPYTFSRPRTALKKIIRIDPHVLLLDIRLGEENGLDIAMELRQRQKTKDLRIIAITAFYEEKEFSYLRDECKVKTCLRKPLKPLEVISAIEDSFNDTK